MNNIFDKYICLYNLCISYMMTKINNTFIIKQLCKYIFVIMYFCITYVVESC